MDLPSGCYVKLLGSERYLERSPIHFQRWNSPYICDNFVLAVHMVLSAIGVDTLKYMGHSFRIGAVTTAAKIGIQDSPIRAMSRWESSTYLLYIHTPREKICSLAKTLLKDRQAEI